MIWDARRPPITSTLGMVLLKAVNVTTKIIVLTALSALTVRIVRIEQAAHTVVDVMAVQPNYNATFTGLTKQLQI